MPSLRYKYSEKEFLKLAEFILSKGCYFVVDEPRETPDMIYIRDYDEMVRNWEWLKISSRKYFILRDDYVECSLFQQSITTKEGQTMYVIQQHYGGPYIELSYFPSSNFGILDHYSYFYYEKVDYYQIKPPEAMVLLYKEICKYIRQTTCVVKYYNRKQYCGPEYLMNVIDDKVESVDDEFRKLVLEMHQEHAFDKKMKRLL